MQHNAQEAHLLDHRAASAVDRTHAWCSLHRSVLFVACLVAASLCLSTTGQTTLELEGFGTRLPWAGDVLAPASWLGRQRPATAVPSSAPHAGRRMRELLFWKRRGRGKRRGERQAEDGSDPQSAISVAKLSPGAEPVFRQVIPQGGALAVECADGTRVREVSYATWGTPLLHPNGSVTTDLRCHSPGALTIVRNACEGQSHCCLPIADQNFRRDPCVGKVKTFAVELRGCAQHIPESKYKTHCALLGQPLLVNEDVEFLAALELPPAPEPVGPWVAAMVDTSFRPELQHFVVHNVHNNTGWPIQLFTGPTSKPKLELLFQDLISRGQMTLTSIGDDYMEDWQRLSSMMLLPTFWRATVGQKVLIFQPDTIMCAKATRHIRDFTQYDYVGPPMAGPYWMTSDHPSQWGIGCGGFSLRDRALSLRMVNTPACITPAAGRLEDQQLGTMWSNVEKRCALAGIHVKKPDRFEAVKFAVEYDLHMDILPGETPAGYPRYPRGCTANYVDMKPSQKAKQWHPTPRPAATPCMGDKGEQYGPFFVPMGCHKCWSWNTKTWLFIREHCPEAVTMRKLRKRYQIGVEFTGFPLRPKLAPIAGPAPVDQRFQPIDMLTGRCVGNCKARPPPTFERTVLGRYKNPMGR